MIAFKLALLCHCLLHQSQVPKDVVELNLHPTKIYVGNRYLVGPVWTPTSQLVFSDVGANSELTLTQGKVAVVRSPAHMAFGHAVYNDGAILVCQRQNRSVISFKGKESNVLASTFSGKRFNGPSDIAVRKDGTILFTDPVVLSSSQKSELEFSGIYSITPDGALHLLDRSMARPQGLALSLDEKSLYVSDSVRMCVKKFELSTSGTEVSAPVEFAFLTGDNAGAPGGIKLDVKGNVYCAGPGGVMVFDPSGKYLGLIYLPDVATNFCFGDADYKTLYITGAYGLYKIRTKIAGHPLFNTSP